MADLKLVTESVGLDDVLSNLGDIKDSVAAADALADAVMSGAQIVVNEAKLNCPVDTGNLRRSIHAEHGETSRDLATVEVGTDVEYAKRIEFGFAGTDSLGRTYNQSSQSYLIRAIDEHRDEVVREIVDAAREQVREALINQIANQATRRRGVL